MASIDPSARPAHAGLSLGAAGQPEGTVADPRPEDGPVSRNPTSSRPRPPAEPTCLAEVLNTTQRNPEAEKVAASFYDAFVAQDFDAMESIYSPGVRFEDPIFEYDSRDGTMGMWRGLLPKAEGMKTSYEVLGSSGSVVKVRWTADYEFAGRPVHNEIVSQLVIEDGRITDQRDSFSWDRWAKQALPLGPLSTSAPVRAAVTMLLRMLVS